MKRVTIFVEGGAPKGHGKGTDLTRMREAFHTFLGLSDAVRIEICGSRKDAYDEFCNALKEEPGRTYLLLVDSEIPLQEGQSRWLHVLNYQQDQWKKPKEATNEQLYFMAQCVEAWLVAHPENMKEYYGEKLGNLPVTFNVEEISKTDLAEKLNRATEKTDKGKYSKTRHLPDILKNTDRSRVRDRAPHCKCLLDHLKSLGVCRD
ncbi:DUF4276 family protein [Armatimonas sp.]|uniref:DUF4276 family protein n=1 Tax=Armatimonas sp. TaxID=1872638 RepID=UPI00375069F0